MPVMTGDIPLLVAKAGHTVTLERPVISEDDLGGRDRAWSVISEDLSCWVQPATAATREEYAERGITITHRVYFGASPAICMGDRLLFGIRYMVVEGRFNTAETSDLWVADCREVKNT